MCLHVSVYRFQSLVRQVEGHGKHDGVGVGVEGENDRCVLGKKTEEHSRPAPGLLEIDAGRIARA